jgi:phosphate transporter
VTCKQEATETTEDFNTALDEQLEKVNTFYTAHESEIYQQIEQLELELKGMGDEKEDTISVNELNSLESTSLQDDSSFEPYLDLKHNIISIYVALVELESFLLINHTILEELLLNTHKKVMNSTPFSPQTTETLRHQILRMETIYADKFCRGFPVDQIKSHLQQQLALGSWKKEYSLMMKQEKDDDEMMITERNERYYRLGKYKIASKHLFNILYFVASGFIFIGLLSASIFDNRQENACFALLMFAALLWATEAIPLYATSYMIPFFIVTLKIMRDGDGQELSAKASAKAIFGVMFSGTIVMLLSGFALAAALSKYGIAKAFATHVLSRAGTRPHWVLLVVMFLAGFLSMFISNVATPVLCFSLIEPILNAEVGPCLILGIALASNIGGMTSPISSPQNIVTIQYLDPNPGWGRWMSVAIPISILSIFVCWGILLFVYKPSRNMRRLDDIKNTSQEKELRFTWRHIFILVVTFITIGLWCAEASLEDRLGDTGIIATLPLFLFFSTGILKKDDLHQRFLWSVVMLAQGGMALGYAVTSCGLLQDIALQIKDHISGLSPLQVLVIFSVFILVFSTFVSHTVAALIIVPIVKEVGEKLPIPHPNLFVMGAGLACSAGMALPISGFPNMSAAMLESPDNKRPYLTTRDFFITGIPTSIVCTILIFTLGYGVMTLIGY